MGRNETRTPRTAEPVGQLKVIFGGSSPISVSLRHHLLRGPKVDEFEIPRDSDTGRESNCPTRANPARRHTQASQSEATVEAAGFIGVPGKPLLLAGVIFNPPSTAEEIKAAFLGPGLLPQHDGARVN